ncbi:MAG: cupin domain-containing protein [Bacteroidetes bacterium]|nr:cupin domain-containing protein [Fibrella sp.]
MENPMNQLFTTAPQEGPTVSVVGDTYRLVVTGKQTGGDYAMIDMLVPPGGGPGPHEHAAFHETYYILDGEVLFQFEDKSMTARKGQLVSIPKGGGVHGFKNVSIANARMICTVVPSGLDEFFMEIGKPVAPDALLPHPPPMGPDEQKRMQAIAERYGQKLYPPDYFDKLNQ